MDVCGQASVVSGKAPCGWAFQRRNQGCNEFYSAMVARAPARLPVPNQAGPTTTTRDDQIRQPKPRNAASTSPRPARPQPRSPAAVQAGSTERSGRSDPGRSSARRPAFAAHGHWQTLPARGSDIALPRGANAAAAHESGHSVTHCPRSLPDCRPATSFAHGRRVRSRSARPTFTHQPASGIDSA